MPKPFQSYSSFSKSNLKQGIDDVYPTGKIYDQPKSILSDSKVSLPQFCDNMLKAAYDHRISAVYLRIDTLNCGWAKLDEIRRQILNFRKSGKLVVAYVTSIGVKEYYIACVCEEIYAPPSAYVSLFGFTLQATFYKANRLEEEGFISKVLDYDEVISHLMKRLEVSEFSFFHFSKYSRIRKWTVGISKGKELIAIIRASGSIGSNIIAENFIKKIRKVRLSKKFKAVIIRINSPGGDALASDLMWREIKRLAATKQVIASMSHMTASGGYHMAMGAGVIVAENLTLTEKIGLNKEVISKGKYSELNDVDQRSFRPDEAELFAKRAQHIYKQFRDNAALSRSMTIDEMEEVAQGRAGIPQDKHVTVVDISRPDPILPNVLRYIGYSLVGAHQTLSFVCELDFEGEGKGMKGLWSGNPCLRVLKIQGKGFGGF
ncbi:signal peptide peptidase family protein [Medicago truncatula]|uniref:Signal peptide peptidase family protein n=1 Tax=Medicago truncatula TaxID=3880 RepID=A0A072V3G6_MEDTR|nr:signal peptide peptidase family protein [Medicago truncatula]